MPLVLINPVSAIAGLLIAAALAIGSFNSPPYYNGNYKGYDWGAKVYEEPSDHGINKGRISKLTVEKDGAIVAHYEREWDVKPAAKNQKAVDDIIEGLESSNSGE